MKKKDIKLFDKAIHRVKDIMVVLVTERETYHKQVEKLTKRHDKKMNSLIKKEQTILRDMYTLFDDLTDNEGK